MTNKIISIHRKKVERVNNLFVPFSTSTYGLMLYILLQLKIERDAGRVFKGWNEGKIYFAPTYKYSFNSDAYAGETATSKKKRRTPAWYVPLLNIGLC